MHLAALFGLRGLSPLQGVLGADVKARALTASFPCIAYVVLAPLLWWLFRRTWRDLDIAAHQRQAKILAEGQQDLRPPVLFAITALVLTLQQYYGGLDFYEEHVHSWLQGLDTTNLPLSVTHGHGLRLYLRKYNELYGYGWWCFGRLAGYIAIPFAVWKTVFRRDSLLDMGLRVRGLRSHAWIYALCLATVLPAVYIVSGRPEFVAYYPFYKHASRSWFDLVCWELMYCAQFFALEIFFRGFWLSGLRHTLGSGAIFAMCVPYCMIHFGKPYLETAGAVVAGMTLGSLAMRTNSIYSGFLVHVTVALAMDLLSLTRHNGFPETFWG